MYCCVLLCTVVYCCAVVQVGTDPDLWEEAVDSLLDEGVPFVLTAFDELDQATDVGFLQVRLVVRVASTEK